MSSNALPAWFYISVWILLGSLMIIFNKFILSTWGFHYPCILTLWHCTLASILTRLLSWTSDWLPGVAEKKVSWKDYATRIVPIAFLFSLGLVFGNMSYNYISVAYIQMIKAITPVPMLLLNFMIGREKPSIVQFIIVLMVSFGVILSSVGELNFSWVGFTLMMSAVMSDVSKLIITDIALKDLSLDSLSLLYYLAPTAAMFIGVGTVYLELNTFPWYLLTSNFLWTLLANGLLAFSLNIAVLLLIKNTSALIISLAGPLKDILLVLSSVFIFQSPITWLQVFGFSITLCSLQAYQEFKRNPEKYFTMMNSTYDSIRLLCGGGATATKLCTIHNVGGDGAEEDEQEDTKLLNNHP